MRTLTLILALFFAAPAGAAEVCLDFLAGPQQDKLVALCEMYRVNLNFTPAEWSNVKCGMRFLLIGAYAVHMEIRRGELETIARNQLRAERQAVRDALPMPTAAPTPTATPTALPTPTPTTTASP